MLYAILKSVHLLSIIVWIGGMVFAHFFLRPALTAFEPAVRVRVMHAVLARFFAAVLVASTLALVTGGWMIGRMAKQAGQSGAYFTMPVEWMIMAALGGVMMVIFVYIRFALFVRLGRAASAADWPLAAAALGKIRFWVTINLTMGILIVLVTMLGFSS